MISLALAVSCTSRWPFKRCSSVRNRIRLTMWNPKLSFMSVQTWDIAAGPSSGGKQLVTPTFQMKKPLTCAAQKPPPAASLVLYSARPLWACKQRRPQRGTAGPVGNTGFDGGGWRCDATLKREVRAATGRGVLTLLDQFYSHTADIKKCGISCERCILMFVLKHRLYFLHW